MYGYDKKIFHKIKSYKYCLILQDELINLIDVFPIYAFLPTSISVI